MADETKNEEGEIETKPKADAKKADAKKAKAAEKPAEKQVDQGKALEAAQKELAATKEELEDVRKLADEAIATVTKKADKEIASLKKELVKIKKTIGPDVEEPLEPPKPPSAGGYADSRAKDKFQTQVLSIISKYDDCPCHAAKMMRLQAEQPELFAAYANEGTLADIERYKAKLKKRKK